MLIGNDTAEAPDLGPEGVGALDRPAVERREILDRFCPARPLFSNVIDECGEVGAPYSFRRG